MKGYYFLLAIAAVWLVGGWLMDMYENGVFGGDDDE